MKKNLLLIGIVVLIATIPLAMFGGAEFGGADGQAEDVISEINPNYEPWFESFWEPPSGEIESLLFSVQAGLGAGFIGYYIGYLRGKKSRDGKDSKC